MDNPSSSMSKAELSQSLLQMKFMKRSLDKRAQEEKEREEKEFFGHGITEAMRQGDKFIMIPSYVPCMNLVVCRLSFNGMNPELERIMELEKMEKVSSISNEMEKDITDAEMAAVATANRMNKNATVPNKTSNARSENSCSDEEWEEIIIEPNTS